MFAAAVTTPKLQTCLGCAKIQYFEQDLLAYGFDKYLDMQRK
jgi:hypothetical protein